jgi:hypothetical protein
MVSRAASDPYSDPRETESTTASPLSVTPVTSRPPPPPGMPPPPRSAPASSSTAPMGVPPSVIPQRPADQGPARAPAPPPSGPPVARPAPPSGPAVSTRSLRPPRRAEGPGATRTLRQIDPWSVLRLSLLFYLCVLLVLLVAGIVLWNIASVFGVLHNFEKFIRQLFDLQSFTLHPVVALEAFALGGVLLVLLGTAVNVIAACLYNLISDVAGGVRVTVVEEESAGRLD